MNLNQEEIKICNECKSEFKAKFSEMENLCPECASILYGYENCVHKFKNNRCEKCYWNGKSSEYIIKLKNSK
jgi:predicted RNA-binding Zn-ribbon protein involved in translation (DUF1610 family)